MSAVSERLLLGAWIRRCVSLRLLSPAASFARSHGQGRALGLSILDGVLFALMVGASESYFGACAVALGHTDTALAILATLPVFAGALAQAATGPLVLWLGTRKRVVVAGALLQALSHLGLIVVAWRGEPSLWPLLSLVMIYFISGMLIAPAWGAWMGGVTEGIDRQRYFAIRSGAVSAAMVVAFVWAGYHLRDAEVLHNVSHTYALLFSVGFVCRLGSAGVLFMQPDPGRTQRDSIVRVMARTRAALRGDGFRLALGLGLLMLGAQISIPFYAPYMLKTLGFGYDSFAKMVAVQLTARALVFPVAHLIAARLGLERMLAGAVALIALVAWMWGGSTNMSILVLAQFMSGIAWACYEFSSFQLLLTHAKPSHRVEFLAVAASLTGILQLTGAMIGSFLLTRVEFSYRGVFLVSAFARCLPLFMFLPLVLERTRPDPTVTGVPAGSSLAPAPMRVVE